MYMISCHVCDAYTKRGNPLFIPETATHSHAAPRLVYTVGHFHAVGYCPFGFEDMGGTFSDMAGVLFGIDTSDPLLSTVQDVGEYAWYARTLGALAPLLTARYGTGKLQAVIHERPLDTVMRFAQFGFCGHKAQPAGTAPRRRLPGAGAFAGYLLSDRLRLRGNAILNPKRKTTHGLSVCGGGRARPPATGSPLAA